MSSRIATLQRQVARLSQARDPTEIDRVALGTAQIDTRIGGGLARGRLHEIVVADSADAAAGTGLAAMLARRLSGTLVWLRVDGQGAALYPPGLVEVGIDPKRVVLVMLPDSAALLRAAGDVTRSTAVGAVIIELWREPRRINLTISRRLGLAAEGSGVTPLLLRVAADPVPSAAMTRWGVTPAPSTPVAWDTSSAPGAPALDLELLRQRGGPAGWRWRVEWDRDKAEFRTPLSGDLVAVPGGGSLGRIRAVG